MVFLKVTDGFETRKIRLSSEQSFDDLKQQLTSLFPSLKDGKDFNLRYTDRDGDIITLSSTEELQAVLEQLPPDAEWRLQVDTSAQGPTRREVPLLASLLNPFWRPRFGLLSWHDHYDWLSDFEDLFSISSRRWRSQGRGVGEAEAQCRAEGERKTAEESSKPHGHNQAQPEEEQKGKDTTTAASQDQEVKSKKCACSAVADGKPQWHHRTIGSWEPRVYESPFLRRTVIGPVAVHVWWGHSGAEGEKEGAENTDKAAENTQQQQQAPEDSTTQ